MGFDTSIPLGKATDYQFEYNPALLFPIARSMGRDVIGIEANHYPFRVLIVGRRLSFLG